MLPDLKQKIKLLFKKKKADCILILNGSEPDPNFFYLTRMCGSSFSHSFVVLKQNSILLAVPKMEYNLAKRQGKANGITVKYFLKKDEIDRMLKKEVKGKRVGLNLSRLSVNSFRSLKKILKKKRFVDISLELAGIRMTKTKPEIALIKKSCKIADRVMKEVPKIIRPGMRERELAAEIDRKMKAYGADEIAFPTIVASGRNSANPHYTAGGGKMKKGDLLLVDFGCKADNYCSDITRTFVIGKSSAIQKDMLETCKRMHDEIINMLKPGVRYWDLQDKANSICKEKYGDLLHMVGHSLGIEVHDPIAHAKGYKELILQEGMVLTVEPALYIKGLGGVRIENDILITKTGCKRLTI